MTVSIVWFRRDLRLEDNDVLAHALIMTRTVIPVYIHAPEEDGPWAMGAAARWWLHHSLAALDGALRHYHSRLVIRRARTSLAGLRALVKETGASLVCWHRLYEPAEVAREDAIEAAMVRAGVTVQTFPGYLLREPDSIQSDTGEPYKVFARYARAAQTRLVLPNPRPEPHHLRRVPSAIASLPLSSLNLLPAPDLAAPFAKRWQPGEAGARQQLRALRKQLGRTAAGRDRSALDAISHLTPHLYFGEVTPARVWGEAALLAARRNQPGRVRGAQALQRELLWREFTHYLLHHFPKTLEQPLEAFHHWRAIKHPS